MKPVRFKTSPLRAALRRLAPGLLLVWLSTLPIVGEELPLVVEIWPGRAPEESANLGAERIVMSPKLDRTQVEVTEPTRMITDVTKPTLTIYRPAKDQDTGTAVLICPGGGYWNLYWQLEGEEVAGWLNHLGVTGIILKYRVPRHPDEPKGEPARRPLQDAQRAVSLVRSKAREWGIRRIGMVGFSAGGHLAIAAATSFVLMYLALKQAGVPAELHVYATAAHDFGVRASDHPCSTWTEACANWLRHQGFLKPVTEQR